MILLYMTQKSNWIVIQACWKIKYNIWHYIGNKEFEINLFLHNATLLFLRWYFAKKQISCIYPKGGKNATLFCGFDVHRIANGLFSFLHQFLKSAKTQNLARTCKQYGLWYPNALNLELTVWLLSCLILLILMKPQCICS